MKHTITNTLGQFEYTIVADVPESGALHDALIQAGILQVIQRTPASAAEKKMAGYEKRPDNFKRGSIPFNDENVLKLMEGFGNEAPVGKKDGPKLAFTIVDVKQYVPAVTEYKFVEEKFMVENHKTKGDLAEWLKAKVQFTGDISDEQAMLLAVKAYKIAATKSL